MEGDEANKLAEANGGGGGQNKGGPPPDGFQGKGGPPDGKGKGKGKGGPGGATPDSAKRTTSSLSSALLRRPVHGCCSLADITWPSI